MAVASRFLIDLRLGPRDLETAKQLVASVALGTADRRSKPPMLLVDNHLPYPSAILEVFGVIQHRRRRHGRGRRKHPRLKPPPGLLVGVVEKLRNTAGRVVKVETHALFGPLKALGQRVVELGIGGQINTAHLERLNGTLRGQQTRLARRTRQVSRGEQWLQWSLWLWRDLYHWVRVHGSLRKRTPAMAQGLADHVWTVPEYVCHPVHVSDLDRALWQEQRDEVLTSPLDRHKRRKTLPTS